MSYWDNKDARMQAGLIEEIGDAELVKLVVYSTKECLGEYYRRLRKRLGVSKLSENQYGPIRDVKLLDKVIKDFWDRAKKKANEERRREKIVGLVGLCG